MKVTVQNKIGDSVYTIDVEASDVKDALIEAAFYGEPHDKCGLCGQGSLRLDGRIHKDFKFVSVICRDCGARKQLGDRKAGGFYWKQWEEAYQGGQQQEIPEKEYDEL